MWKYSRVFLVLVTLTFCCLLFVFQRHRFQDYAHYVNVLVTSPNQTNKDENVPKTRMFEKGTNLAETGNVNDEVVDGKNMLESRNFETDKNAGTNLNPDKKVVHGKRLFETRFSETAMGSGNISNSGHMNDIDVDWKNMESARETERVYRERVRYAMSQCYTQDKRKVATVMTHDGNKLAYCKVPKVGCTFWIRTLLYLYNDTGAKAVKSPFDIPRMFVHSGGKKHLQTYLDFSLIQSKISNYTRFLFARDPYSRLWSAYLDKYRLPDFWRSSAASIIRRRNVTSEKAKKCRHDISFIEFLQFVVTNSPQRMNEHWIPVSYQCDPCLFKPTVIGKVETFNDDAKYILKKIGLEKILSSYDNDAYVEGEMKMLSDYNFKLLRIPFYNECLTERSMALLLWKVFQLNGYLPKEVKGADALKDLNNIDRESFTELVINYYRSASKEDKQKWKLQKAAALKDAFRSIPTSVADKLVSIYKSDFNMFGYDAQPPA